MIAGYTSRPSTKPGSDRLGRIGVWIRADSRSDRTGTIFAFGAEELF